MRQEERVLKVKFQSLVSKKWKYQKQVTPHPSHPISLVRQQNRLLPKQKYGALKISRLPYKIFQSLIIVVVSEWRKGKPRQHYSVTAADQFVRMCTEGGCNGLYIQLFMISCWSAWSAQTEQLNEVLAPEGCDFDRYLSCSK